MDFLALAHQCAPTVEPSTMAAVARVESSFNPFAIGVVGGRLERQPRNLDEAVSTAEWLDANGYNFSVGLGQVNKHNFGKYGLTTRSAFDACMNVYAAGEILKECFSRAQGTRHDEQAALRDAFSCYYSGNFTTGYQAGYVLKIVSAAQTAPASSAGAATGRIRLAKQGKREVKSSATVAHEDAPAGVTSSSTSSLLF